MSNGVQHIAAFCNGNSGGNPAGVLIADELPSLADMQRVAKEVGYSETVFAAQMGETWRVRYFSPEREIPFCGHATIALGAALAIKQGDGVFPLRLNDGEISVQGQRKGDGYAAALQSPPTTSQGVSAQAFASALELFGLQAQDLDEDFPPAVIHAGANHLALMLTSREKLASMAYDLETGQNLMRQHGWVTIVLCYAETPQLFHVRNPFAYGGLYEDPATGASAAALAGYLREIGWTHGGAIEIRQGDDMGIPCRLRVEISPIPGSSVRVSGLARLMNLSKRKSSA